MAIVWVNDTFDGFLKTGAPSTTIHIERDCNGCISPIGQAAMLYLTVKGFMSRESLRSIDYHGYAEFKAVVSTSDQPAGVYPREGFTASTLSGLAGRRWTVLASTEVL